jgi:hypothetical protein
MMNAQLLPWYSDEDDRARWQGLYIDVDESGSEGYEYWWWFIKDETTGQREYSFEKKGGRFSTRAEARQDAEAAARCIIEARYSALFYHLFKWDPLYH